MTEQEAKDWLSSSPSVRCKEKASGLIFDSMLWEGDTAIVRQATPDPTELYIISLDLFAEKFGAIGD